MMPPGGADARADQFEALERIQHDRLDRSRARRLLDALEPWAASADPDSDDAALIRACAATTTRPSTSRPSSRRRSPSAAAHAQQAWMEAREAGDFKRFAPALERVLELQSRYIACFDGTGEFAHPYDVLLDDYEPGLTTEELRGALHAPAGGARPARLGRRGGRRGRPRVPRPLPASRPSRRLADELLHAVGFETEHWRLDASVHPFARSMAASDVRLTTRWEEDDLAMAFYSCLHEFGHGLYEAQFDPRHYRTTLAEAAGLGVHESQCRLWENLVGRSRPFCEWVLPLLRRHLGGPFEAHRRRRALPRGQPGPALAGPDRGRRDDLQPPHRAALRARARAGRGPAAVADLPDAWDEATHRLLGLEAPSVMEGVLQDIHWGAGMIGYFPTYTIGNLMAAQLWRALAADLPDIDGRSRRATSRRCASGCARTSTATAASTTRASCCGGRRGRS